MLAFMPAKAIQTWTFRKRSQLHHGPAGNLFGGIEMSQTSFSQQAAPVKKLTWKDDHEHSCEFFVQFFEPMLFCCVKHNFSLGVLGRAFSHAGMLATQQHCGGSHLLCTCVELSRRCLWFRHHCKANPQMSQKRSK